MPPIIFPLPQRLAVLPVAGTTDDRVISWLDLTLNFLRTRHRKMVLVEREDLRTVLQEVGIQYTGRVDEETTIRVGKLVGADSLLTYRLALSGPAEPVSASFELRLLQVESGITVFRQITSATMSSAVAGAATGRINESSSSARRLVVEEATAYGFAALAAAFGDNSLGVVADYSWPGEGLKLLGLLQGSPAFLAGLKPGDQVLALDGQPLGSWIDPIALPVRVTAERDGERLEINVRQWFGDFEHSRHKSGGLFLPLGWYAIRIDCEQGAFIIRMWRCGWPIVQPGINDARDDLWFVHSSSSEGISGIGSSSLT
jgi:hypothetical protein